MTKQKQKLIAVCGMHRSGTSAVTRGLKTLGVDLGNHLLEALPQNNEKGFWEDIDVNTLNNEILEQINSEWHYLRSVNQEDVDRLYRLGYVTRATELLHNKIADKKVFGIKDPRIAKLLPFWNHVFSQCNYEIFYVFPIRHPLSVAQSLAKRDGFDHEKSYWLWLEHIIPVLQHAAPGKCAYISYDRMIENPEGELRKISSIVGLDIDLVELEVYKSEFLEEKLRHTFYNLADLAQDPTIPSIVKDVYSFLTILLDDPQKSDLNKLKQKLTEWTKELEANSSIRDLADKLYTRYTQTHQAVLELNHQLATESNVVLTLRQHTECLEGAVMELKNTVDALTLDRDSQKDAESQLQQRITQLDKLRHNNPQDVVSKLQQGIAQLDELRQSQKDAMSQLQQRIAQLDELRHEQIDRLNEVIAERDSAKMELSRIYASRSWRLTTALVRNLTRALTRIRGHRIDNELSIVAQPAGVFSASMAVPNAVELGAEAEPHLSGKRHVLLVSYYFPTRAHAGGLRILDIYKLIKQQYPAVQLDLLTHHRPSIDWSIDDVYEIFDNVYLSPTEELTLSTLKALTPERELRYDIVDLQFHQAAYHLDEFKRIASKVLFTPMESQTKVLYLEIQNQIKGNRRIGLKGLAAQFKLAYEEISFFRKADKVICVSKADAAFMRLIGSGRRIHGIDTGISSLEFADALTDDFLQVPASNRPRVVIYVAYFGSETNVNALRWYLQSVHPLVVESVPDYKVVVVGRGDLSSFETHRGPHVELVGEVPTLAPYIRSAKLGIAPALGGSGFRGKVNQYAILGVPAVVSSIALKGLAYRNGENIFVADDARDFANHCIRLLTDDALNDQVAQEARQFCLNNYSWASKWPEIESAYGLEKGVSC